MNFTIQVEAEDLTEINPTGEKIIIHIDLSKIWAAIEKADAIYMQITLQVPIQEKEIRQMTEVVINRSFQVRLIKNQKIQMEIPYMAAAVAPITGEIDITSYSVAAEREG